MTVWGICLEYPTTGWRITNVEKFTNSLPPNWAAVIDEHTGAVTVRGNFDGDELDDVSTLIEAVATLTSALGTPFGIVIEPPDTDG